MKTYFIYKLTNPIDNSIFYIGYTTKNLESRLKAHIAESIFWKRTKKHKIINEILIHGKVPLIEILEKGEHYSHESIREIEQYWIFQYLTDGHTLSNCQMQAKLHKQER